MRDLPFVPGGPEHVGSSTGRLYSIWAEGYLVSGMEGIPARALRIGAQFASSFREACVLRAQADPQGFGHYFNEAAMTYWGCRLFDNEADARKAYG